MLGDYTQDEYRELLMKYNAIRHAHEAMHDWLKPPIAMRIETKA